MSSGQISALRSAISTNSRARIRFTTFGGRAAAGLYGPIVCRVAGSALSATCLSCVLVSLAATTASSSSPDATCMAGANVGISGSCAGLGSVPSGLVGGTACERREPRLRILMLAMRGLATL